MGTTSQDLTWVELEGHGWQREGPRGTRAMFNEAHRLLLYNEDENNIVYDPAIGDLPFLETQNNIFAYEAPADCWLVKGVLVDRDQSFDSEDIRREDIIIAGIEYYRVLNVKTMQSKQGQLARLMFVSFNPGDTEEIFKLLYYRMPIQILSDNIQHEMPGTTDEDYLIPATVKLMEGIGHGNIIEARQYITRELKPQFQIEADRGEQGVSKFCVKRAF